MNDIIERPTDADDDAPMEAVLVRNSDGARRIYRPDWKPTWTWSDEYWWTEGNFGCDCNRRLTWARCADPPEDEPENQECGHGEFSVILRSPT
jgi:hypothetical protein